MLHDCPIIAVNHRIVLGMLQQNAHDGGFGNVGMYLLRHALICIALQKALAEARAVVIVGGHQSRLQLLRDMHCRPGGQITTLGVSADTKRTVRAGSGDLACISRGPRLRRDSLQKAHVEVFLPTGKTAVRTHKCHINALIRQKKRNGIELHLLHIITAAFVGKHPHLAKTRCLRRGTHQGDVFFLAQA